MNTNRNWNRESAPSWLLVALIFALLLALAPEGNAAAPTERATCQAFTSLDDDSRLAVTISYIHGIWFAAPAESANEIIAAIALDQPDYARLVAKGAKTACHLALAESPEADAYAALQKAWLVLVKVVLEEAKEAGQAGSDEAKITS